MNAIKIFKVNTNKLSLKEKAVLNKLVLATKLIAPLYLKQKNDNFPGANFYPKKTTKKEIEKAAEKNSLILDPYTFVEKDKSGKLTAVPYHIKFKKELLKIARILNEAAEISEDPTFSCYLKSRAESLITGNYEKSEIIWLTTQHFKFGLVIGPIERYLDKLFFRKCAYQAWVGILDEKKTKEAERLKNAFLSSRRKILPGSAKVDISKLDVRVDQNIIFSGLIADFMFTGTNLPNDVSLMEKYGSNFTIFENSLSLKFQKDHYPIFKNIFSKSIQKNYSKEDLYEGSLRCILLHEISHSLIRYRDAEERLGNLFPVFDEIFAYILGIKGCGILFLKGYLTQKDLEALLIMHICRNFTWWLDSLENPNTADYALGAAIAQNFFTKEGALKTEEGISWPDFTKLFICIDELSHLLEYYLALGKRDEAQEFVDKYGSFDVFNKFSKNLARFLKKT